jgi:hypothetical protein
MPDDLDDDEVIEVVDPDEQAKRDLRELRRKAKRADELDAKLAAYEKKDVFREARVDLSSPIGQYLFDTWTGDMTVEAISARAEELGCVESSAPTTQDTEQQGPSDDERRSTDERANFHAGGEPESGQQAQPDPRVMAVKAANDAIAAGRTEDDGLAAGVRTMFERAQAGDPRASWDPSRS